MSSSNPATPNPNSTSEETMEGEEEQQTTTVTFELNEPLASLNMQPLAALCLRLKISPYKKVGGKALKLKEVLQGLCLAIPEVAARDAELRASVVSSVQRRQNAQQARNEEIFDGSVGSPVTCEITITKVNGIDIDFDDYHSFGDWLKLYTISGVAALERAPNSRQEPHAHVQSCVELYLAEHTVKGRNVVKKHLRAYCNM